jgi:hypothetical protein
MSGHSWTLKDFSVEAKASVNAQPVGVGFLLRPEVEISKPHDQRPKNQGIALSLPSWIPTNESSFFEKTIDIFICDVDQSFDCSTAD